jgi:prevent-host-death family protein
MTESVQSTDLRRRVREVLDRVQKEQKPIVVRTYGDPQAVLIPYEEYDSYQAWQTQRQKRAAWMDELQAIADQVSARANLSTKGAEALIEEAKKETGES